MKKVFIAVAIMAVLSGCSTTKTVDVDPVTKDAVKYTQEFGKVEVTFNDKGEWESLKSTATSAIPLSDNAALEQAMNVASMRAKRNIVEFVSSDVKSSKTTDAIVNALAKDVSSDDAKGKERAGKIASNITEKISVEANGIVRGAYILDRKVSDDKTMVVVTMQVDKRSMRAASQFNSSMMR
jgi:uncharacterized protein YceK